ncbi:CHAP domain-containing protein [Streptomyces caniscabiei]|uniref:CHAP domain-containing protein n=1 Tax=Streptomyces caniscabiei TaxID=2746961 RepID=UPI0029AA6BA9|nr:CHAP domain-containing protein [Streptomyces caniscabiei]MDX2776390.1 CHAP domain-containing protein [Streptomyces caniscabiei]
MPTITPDSKSEQDKAYDPEELRAAELFPEAYARHDTSHHVGSPKKSTANTEEDSAVTEKEATSGAASGVDDVREKEQTGGGWQNNYTGTGASRTSQQKGLFRVAFAKKGPLGLLLAILGIGGVGMVSGPSLLPIWASKGLENFYGNVSRAASPHYKAITKFSIGNTDACKDASSVRCKMASVNDDTLERYAKQGFKIDSEKVGDRHLIKSATFPDGTTVNNGEDFVAHTDRSISARSSAFGVFNPRSGPYVGTSFTELLNKFGLSKARITLTGSDREEQARSFNREVGAPQGDEEEEERNNRSNQAESEIKGKAAKSADKVKNILGLACAAYDTARISLATVKFMNAVEYMAFGYFVLKLGDQIRTGDIDGTTLAIAAGMLTRVASSGDYKGKSAMDSPGMKAVLHGDRTNLQGAAQNILLGGNPALKKLDDTLKFVKEQLGTTSTHTACKASEDFLVGSALTAAMCATGGGGAGSIIPGLGTAVGGLAGTAICTAGNLAVALVGSLIMGAVLDRVMPAVLDYFKNKPLTYDSPVEDIGNGITIGAGLLFASTGTGKGMKLGTKDEVDTFQTKVAYEADKEYAEVARYQAKDTPLDITNQYSFASQFLSQVTTGMGSNVVSSALASVTSTLSNAQSSLISSAANAADMPSPVKDYTMGECQDAELAEQNIACNSVGVPLTIQSSAEMNRDEGANLAYMIGNDYIEEDGTVNPDKDYAKFLQYCTKQEGTIPGSSNLSIADDDYDWPTEKCNDGSEMISNFRTRAFRFDLKKDEDTAYKDQGGGTAPQETAPEGSDIVGDDYKSEVRSVLGRAGTGQCVDFVLFRLVKHGVLDGPVALGNGKDVVGTLGRMGYKVDTTPAVHAVMSTPVTSQPQYGHTAMVSQVNADGSFVVEEYNFADALKYGTRTIPASDIAAKKMTFAHTEVDYK